MHSTFYFVSINLSQRLTPLSSLVRNRACLCSVENGWGVINFAQMALGKHQVLAVSLCMDGFVSVSKCSESRH